MVYILVNVKLKLKFLGEKGVKRDVLIEVGKEIMGGIMGMGRCFCLYMKVFQVWYIFRYVQFEVIVKGQMISIFFFEYYEFKVMKYMEFKGLEFWWRVF